MRSLEEILRSYNVVNSRAASRYTIRFAAILALAGVFVIAAAMLLTGGPEQARYPQGGGPAASEDDGGGDPIGDERDPIDPFQMTTLEGTDWVYVGYPLAEYDTAHADGYDTERIETAVVEWLADHPTTPTLGTPEAIHDPEGDGVLMGYMIRTLDDGLD